MLYCNMSVEQCCCVIFGLSAQYYKKPSTLDNGKTKLINLTMLNQYGHFELGKNWRFADVKNCVLVKAEHVNHMTFHVLSYADIKDILYWYTLMYIHVAAI